MSKKAIPAEIKREVEEIVTTCNRQVLKDPNYYYVTRYRGLYLYPESTDKVRRNIENSLQRC